LLRNVKRLPLANMKRSLRKFGYDKFMFPVLRPSAVAKGYGVTSGAALYFTFFETLCSHSEEIIFFNNYFSIEVSLAATSERQRTSAFFEKGWGVGRGKTFFLVKKGFSPPHNSPPDYFSGGV